MTTPSGINRCLRKQSEVEEDDHIEERNSGASTSIFQLPPAPIDEHDVNYLQITQEMEELRRKLNSFMSMREKHEEVHDTMKDDMIKFMENLFTDCSKAKDKMTLLACYDFLLAKFNSSQCAEGGGLRVMEARFEHEDARTRMLMHKLCAFLGLDHNIIGPHQKDTMIIQRIDSHYRDWPFSLHELCRFFELQAALKSSQGSVDALYSVDSIESKACVENYDNSTVNVQKVTSAREIASSKESGSSDSSATATGLSKSSPLLRNHVYPKFGSRMFHSQPTREGTSFPFQTLRRCNTDTSNASTIDLNSTLQLPTYNMLEVPPPNCCHIMRNPTTSTLDMVHSTSNNSSLDDSGMSNSPISYSPHSLPMQLMTLRDDLLVWHLVQSRVTDIPDGEWIFYGPSRYPSQLMRVDGSAYTLDRDCRYAYVPAVSRGVTPAALDYHYVTCNKVMFNDGVAAATDSYANQSCQIAGPVPHVQNASTAPNHCSLTYPAPQQQQLQHSHMISYGGASPVLRAPVQPRVQSECCTPMHFLPSSAVHHQYVYSQQYHTSSPCASQHQSQVAVSPCMADHEQPLLRHSLSLDSINGILPATHLQPHYGHQSHYPFAACNHHAMQPGMHTPAPYSSVGVNMAAFATQQQQQPLAAFHVQAAPLAPNSSAAAAAARSQHPYHNNMNIAPSAQQGFAYLTPVVGLQPAQQTL